MEVCWWRGRSSNVLISKQQEASIVKGPRCAWRRATPMTGVSPPLLPAASSALGLQVVLSSLVFEGKVGPNSPSPPAYRRVPEVAAGGVAASPSTLEAHELASSGWLLVIWEGSEEFG